MPETTIETMDAAVEAAYERWLANAAEVAGRGENPHNTEPELFAAGYRAAVADLKAGKIS